MPIEELGRHYFPKFVGSLTSDGEGPWIYYDMGHIPGRPDMMSAVRAKGDSDGGQVGRIGKHAQAVVLKHNGPGSPMTVVDQVDLNLGSPVDHGPYASNWQPCGNYEISGDKCMLAFADFPDPAVSPVSAPSNFTAGVAHLRFSESGITVLLEEVFSPLENWFSLNGYSGDVPSVSLRYYRATVAFCPEDGGFYLSYFPSRSSSVVNDGTRYTRPLLMVRKYSASGAMEWEKYLEESEYGLSGPMGDIFVADGDESSQTRLMSARPSVHEGDLVHPVTAWRLAPATGGPPPGELSSGILRISPDGSSSWESLEFETLPNKYLEQRQSQYLQPSSRIITPASEFTSSGYAMRRFRSGKIAAANWDIETIANRWVDPEPILFAQGSISTDPEDYGMVTLPIKPPGETGVAVCVVIGPGRGMTPGFLRSAPYMSWINQSGGDVSLPWLSRSYFWDTLDIHPYSTDIPTEDSRSVQFYFGASVVNQANAWLENARLLVHDSDVDYFFYWFPCEQPSASVTTLDSVTTVWSGIVGNEEDPYWPPDLSTLEAEYLGDPGAYQLMLSFGAAGTSGGGAPEDLLLHNLSLNGTEVVVRGFGGPQTASAWIDPFYQERPHEDHFDWSHFGAIYGLRISEGAREDVIRSNEYVAFIDPQGDRRDDIGEWIRSNDYSDPLNPKFYAHPRKDPTHSGMRSEFSTRSVPIGQKAYNTFTAYAMDILGVSTPEELDLAILGPGVTWQDLGYPDRESGLAAMLGMTLDDLPILVDASRIDTIIDQYSDGEWSSFGDTPSERHVILDSLPHQLTVWVENVTTVIHIGPDEAIFAGVPLDAPGSEMGVSNYVAMLRISGKEELDLVTPWLRQRQRDDVVRYARPGTRNAPRSRQMSGRVSRNNTYLRDRVPLLTRR